MIIKLQLLRGLGDSTCIFEGYLPDERAEKFYIKIIDGFKKEIEKEKVRERKRRKKAQMS